MSCLWDVQLPEGVVGAQWGWGHVGMQALYILARGSEVPLCRLSPIAPSVPILRTSLARFPQRQSEEEDRVLTF